MKNLNLNGFGVQEMNAEEMRETDGGGGFWIGVIVGGLASELLFEGPSKCWADFIKGFNSVSSID